MENMRNTSDIAKFGGACSRRNKGFRGVPTHCWCGAEIGTFVSKTSRNPFQRFYRCKIAIERKWENHLFQWVDEALAEEISLVEERQRAVEEDLENMRNTEKQVEEDMRRAEKCEDNVALQNNGCLGVFAWLCCKLW